jgi:hypothetical protein
VFQSVVCDDDLCNMSKKAKNYKMKLLTYICHPDDDGWEFGVGTVREIPVLICKAFVSQSFAVFGMGTFCELYTQRYKCRDGSF